MVRDLDLGSSVLVSIGILQDARKSSKEEVDDPRRKIAYCFVSIACFVLATFVGYVTRPR
jgi:hypothetical protein